MPIAFEIQQGLPCVFTNLPNLLLKHIAVFGQKILIPVIVFRGCVIVLLVLCDF